MPSPRTACGQHADCLWAVCGRPVNCPWPVRELPLGCPWGFCGVKVVCQWAVRGPSDRCSRTVSGLTSAGCSWTAHRPPIGCPRPVLGLFVRHTPDSMPWKNHQRTIMSIVEYSGKFTICIILFCHPAVCSVSFSYHS